MHGAFRRLLRRGALAAAVVAPAAGVAAAYRERHRDVSHARLPSLTRAAPAVVPRALAEPPPSPPPPHVPLRERVAQRMPHLPDIPAAEVRASAARAAAAAAPDKPLLVTWGDAVFDISQFVDGHPGGAQILLAAGGPLEPFFAAYALHHAAFVFDMLQELRVGNLVRDAQWPADEARAAARAGAAAYADEPPRDPRLVVRSSRPYTAEPPAHELVRHPLTPAALFYVRNHMPVPRVDVDDYALSVQDEAGNVLAELSLHDLQTRFPKHTVRAALQCAGNRRSELDAVAPVRGGRWGAAAVANAEWGGARLDDVLHYALRRAGRHAHAARHVVLEGLDEDAASRTRYEASVPVDVLRRVPHVLLAYEMNGQPLTRDHGFPLRALVPGVVGARSVKWLARVALAADESASHWQRRDYRCVQRAAAEPRDGAAAAAAWDAAPSIVETPVVSAICSAELHAARGCVVAEGYAVGGAGAPVVLVELSADGGRSWHAAQLQPTRPHARDVYDWTLWRAEVPLPPGGDGGDGGDGDDVVLLCRAEDAGAQRQPAEAAHVWNARGLLNNSWHRVATPRRAA